MSDSDSLKFLLNSDLRPRTYLLPMVTWRPATLLKRDSNEAVSEYYHHIFKSSFFFIEHLR